MSGCWFHVAAVYDPISRRVTQYVNGEQVSNEEIVDKFYISKLRIGPAEIGNWGMRPHSVCVKGKRRYRNRRKRFGLRFNLISAIYNFEL